MSKNVRTRDLRYKRPALASMGWEEMKSEIYQISEACDLVRWYEDNDEDTLLNALDGDEDDLYEFKMAFSDLGAKAGQLWDAVNSIFIDGDTYDDCTVALIGNRYRTIGYDYEEEDYMALTSFEQGLAETEAGKRLMRLTKAEMISTIGQCFGILVAFLDLRQSYDYLKATIDILKDENTSLLNVIREINAAYLGVMDAEYDERGELARRRFDALVEQIPERIWIE